MSLRTEVIHKWLRLGFKSISILNSLCWVPSLLLFISLLRRHCKGIHIVQMGRPRFWEVRVIFIRITVVSSLSCVWLFCDPMDCNLPCPFVHHISQTRILEFHFHLQGPSRPKDQTHVLCIGECLLYHCAAWESLHSHSWK